MINSAIEAAALDDGAYQAAEKAFVESMSSYDTVMNEPAALRAAIAVYLAASGAARDGTVTVLPDGSAFSVASFPLPSGHWLYAPQCAEWDAKRDTSADTPIPIVGNDQRALVIAAMRWAIRGATMNGKEMDFDPDALALNAAYALCGPCVSTAWQPLPAPPGDKHEGG